MRRRYWWFGLTALAWTTVTMAQPVLLVQDERAESLYDTYVRTSHFQRALHRAGLEHDRIAADRVGWRGLRAQQVAVLPANPSLSDAAADWLRRFALQGGKLLVCPPVPPQLAGLVGVGEPGRLSSARDHILDAVHFDTTLVPGLPPIWRQLDWVYQPFTPQGDVRLVGRWQGTDPLLQDAPVLACTDRGAFLGASLQGDDRLAEAQLLMILATTWFPQLWHRALPSILDQVGRVGDLRSLHQLRGLVERSPVPDDRRLAANLAVDAAAEQLARARRLYAYGKQLSAGRGGQAPATTAVERYLPVARLSWSAQTNAEQAYYLAQTGRPGEFHGVWLQQAGDLRSWGWERIIRALKEQNVQALFLNVASGGYANYPSAVLPHVTAEGEDPLREVLGWCRKLGVQCHVWMICNYIRPLTPADHLAKLRADGRVQQDRSGRYLPWLRPSDPRNLAQHVAVAREIAQRYEVDGIHLDYIRYSPEGDFSNAERALFEQRLGHPAGEWPDEVDRVGPSRALWSTWRQEHVNRQVEAIASGIRRTRPTVKVSAAVYPIWADAKLQVGQDPEHWAHEGWVDFLCPMNYHTDDTTFFRYLRVQQRAAGQKVPLYPGLAAWRQETPADTISQVRRLREEGMSGWVLFHLDRRLLREWLPAMRLGLTGPDPWLGPAPPPVVGN